MSAVTSSSSAGRPSRTDTPHGARTGTGQRGAARSTATPGRHPGAYLSPAAFRYGSAFADHSKKSFEPNS